MPRRVLYACGACWAGRGGVRTYATVEDLARHASQKHPALGYVPLKKLVPQT